MSLQGITFGAPGVYVASEMTPRILGLEPMDVVAFVGVAPRGPAWEPVGDATWVESGQTRQRSVAVAVDSWDDYVERFGGFEGPGLLPFAVATFFAQGGRSAYVVRIVHDEVERVDGVMTPKGCAEIRLRSGDGDPAQQPVSAGPDLVSLRARNEGTWGDRLSAELSFSATPTPVTAVEPTALVVGLDTPLPLGSLVRLVTDDGIRILRWVTARQRRGRPSSPVVDVVVGLDGPVPVGLAHVERVEATLDVVDRDPARLRRERFEGLGLRPGHPRFLGDVLAAESRLVELATGAAGIDVNDHDLPSVGTPGPLFRTGIDRWALITPEDMFGRLLEGDDSASAGLDALRDAPEVASIVVPDLYSPGERRDPVQVLLPGLSAGPEFAACVDVEERRQRAPAPVGLVGLALDPLDAADLERIVLLQQRVVDVAERLGWVALLDVPPGLRQRAVLRWRSRFNSSYAAAYHPWLRAPHPAIDAPLVTLNPSAVAAGIIARCERRTGVPRGPANEAAVGIVDVVDRVDDARHGELHQTGVDVFVFRPDGVWLTGARTLSADQQWRQLTVRRVVSLIERAVAHQLQWTVFEPNDDLLRAGLTRALDQLLGELFLQGAFAGDTPETSWFVHVAAGHALGLESDAGQVVVEVGVAPSQPTEFIVVRVSLDADGALRAQVPAVSRG